MLSAGNQVGNANNVTGVYVLTPQLCPKSVRVNDPTYIVITGNNADNAVYKGIVKGMTMCVLNNQVLIPVDSATDLLHFTNKSDR